MIKIINCTSREVTAINPTIFPDGTKLIKFEPIDGGIYGITWLYDGEHELFELISLTKHLKNCGCEVHLKMPYVPNARMDRVKNIDEVFTLKYFADTINWLGFDSITICNPHSTVSEALFNKCRSDFNIVKCDIQKILMNDPTIEAIYYPDAGAHKKFGDMLSSFNLPYMYGEKNRDWKTGQINGLSIMNPLNCKGKTCLIVDDIISYGGSMYFSALELQKLGFEKIICYATHVENSILNEERGKLIKLDCVKKIYTTNSIFRGNHSKIEIISEF